MFLDMYYSQAEWANEELSASWALLIQSSLHESSCLVR